MDIRKVKKLIELVKTTNISELEIHEGEESVRISHNKITKTEPQKVIFTNPPEEPKPKPKEPEKNHGHTVKSPMVGTVFLAPSAGSKPFVEIGQNVKIGDTLCIIEAMKMFNQVETDKTGVVSACLVDNSHPVEYSQPLFIIEEK